MAQRRMFSPEIVCSEEFLEMPPSSRELYFQLAIRADDDGFIQPKGVLRLTGATTDDLKILLSKRFLLPFESGVVVIKHWLIHNMIRLDRYKETRFIEEKNQLFIKENKAYTEDSTQGKPLATKWQPNGNLPAPQVRLGKDSNTSVAIAPPVSYEKEDKKPEKESTAKYPHAKEVFALWGDYPKHWLNPKFAIQRAAAESLYEELGLEEIQASVDFLKKHIKEKFCPKIHSPHDLLEKYSKLDEYANSHV